MSWRSRRASLAIAVSAFVLLIAASGSRSGFSATYDGRDIDPSDVPKFHCHDGLYPGIRCFDTELQRDADASTVAESRRIGSTPDTISTVYYVTFYEHSGYGGSSFTTSQPLSNLGSIGWNDIISSFKSLNGGRPKWWEDAGPTGFSWQWAAGSNVTYVGDGANDRFSAVADVP